MHKKRYLLDGEPISPRELIRAAQRLGMNADWLLTTSQAATFLRTKCQAVVEENPDLKES